jgi:hypothetical protein
MWIQTPKNKVQVSFEIKSERAKGHPYPFRFGLEFLNYEYSEDAPGYRVDRVLSNALWFNTQTAYGIIFVKNLKWKLIG